MDTLNFTPSQERSTFNKRRTILYISIRVNIDHRSVYKIAKELHSPYNTIKQEVQCRTEYLYAGTDFMCDGGATTSYYYGPLKPNN